MYKKPRLFFIGVFIFEIIMLIGFITMIAINKDYQVLEKIFVAFVSTGLTTMFICFIALVIRFYSD